MQTTAIIEETITFESDGLRLTGVMAYPDSQEPENAVLLCSPHPHFAGDMDNNVITELAQYLATDSVTLRFDYRGIGDSQIHLPEDLSVFDYWDTIEESKNYDDAVSDVVSAGEALSRTTGGLPQIAIGYSFGAATAFIYGMKNDRVKQLIGIAPPLTKVDFSFLSECEKPAFVMFGQEDFLYSADDIEEFKKMVSPSTEIDLLDGCDHFFRGDEKHIAKKSYHFISHHTNQTGRPSSCS
jgi:alpha/beta superfamily hydrolase